MENKDLLKKEDVRDIIDIEISWIRMTMPSNYKALKALDTIKQKLHL